MILLSFYGKNIKSVYLRQFLHEVHDVPPLAQELAVQLAVEPHEGNEEGDDLLAAEHPEGLEGDLGLFGADRLAGV